MQLKNENTELKANYEALKKQYAEMNDSALAEFEDAKLVVDGMETAQISKGIAWINDEAYYNAAILRSIAGEKIAYNSDEKTVYYGEGF